MEGAAGSGEWRMPVEHCAAPGSISHLLVTTKAPDVVDAVKDGKFHVYPVEHIDQGIEILTGKSAGVPDDEGAYPEDTINYLVQCRITELAHTTREFAAKGD